MANADWRQVKEIFVDAMRQPLEERPHFLDLVCGGDKLLRSEVESLLASRDEAESFLESPAIGEFAESLAAESSQFANGQILAHYEIIKKIGAGGMGEVYLARDTRLERQVAVKILHQNLSDDTRTNERLWREARAAARLEHPNICRIYEIAETDECGFIVMEYVAGETLADLLSKERLSAEKSLALAIQIADALEEAHLRGIIHRDIKPSNVIVNGKNQAKVLDFGLAKFLETETGGKTQKLSSSGAIIGTVPFMSPEQLRGRRLDARTDVFSFGALFYEMLSGVSLFQKDSNAETISAILNDELDLSRIPPELRSIAQKSLSKDKNGRYQTARDLAADLRSVGEISAETGGTFENPVSLRRTAGQKPSQPRYFFWKSSDSGDKAAPQTNRITGEPIAKPEKFNLNYAAAFSVFAAVLILSGAAIWYVRQSPKVNDSHSFDALRPVSLVSWKTGANSPYSDFRVSHDGKMLAYSSTQEGGSEGIYIKQTGDGADFRVTRDEWSNHSPVWSPDDRRIAFASFRENQSGIYVCPSLGGQTTLLKIIGAGNVALRHWSKDGAAIFYETGGNLFQLEIASGETSQITDLKTKIARRYFDVSPNEDKIVYLDKTGGQEDLWTMPIIGGVPARLTDDADGEIQPRWHSDGERILYTVFRSGHYQINVARSDGRAPEQITRGESEFELIDLSPDGSRIFYLSWEEKSDIWGVNIETGEEFEVAAAPESEFWSEVAPDGKSILYQSNSSPYPSAAMSESLIVVKSLVNQTPPLSLKGYNPRWLPDSRRIAFLRQETSGKYLLWTFDIINGEEKQLGDNPVSSLSFGILPNNRAQTGEFDWSPDGSQIVYLSNNSQTLNVLKTAPETNRTESFTNNDNPNLAFYSPKWSPDGIFFAYVSSQKPLTKDDPPRWSVWVVKEGKPTEIYSTAASLRFLGWSDDGKILLETTDGAMSSIPLDVKLVKVSTNGGSQIVTAFKNIYAKSMTLAADGKTVAFTSRQDGRDNIYTASISGGAKKITVNADAKLFYGSPAFSPEGKAVFFDK